MFKKNLATAGRAAPAAQGPAALLLIVAGLRLSKNRPKHPCRLSLPSRLGLQRYNLYPYVAHPTRTFFREICEKYRNKLTYSMIKLHNFHENTDRKTETKEKTKEKHQNMKTPIIYIPHTKPISSDFSQQQDSTAYQAFSCIHNVSI